MKERKNKKLPVLCNRAAKLYWVCIALITAYLTCALIYIHFFSHDPMMPRNALQMLQNAVLSLVIALGGALLFDLEMRFSGNNR